MRLLLLLSFLVTIGQTVFADTQIEYYHSIHYTSEMGLPHSLVFDIAQSKDGFIWVATNNGLGRFDGYNFKVYRPQKDRKDYISGKSITKLFFDNQNNLWLSIQGLGLNKMNLTTEKFESYLPNNTVNGDINGNFINYFFQASDGTIWVGSNKGLEYLNTLSNTFSNCHKNSPTNENNIKYIAEDTNANIWFLSNQGIGCYNTKKHTIKTFNELVNQPWTQELEVNSILLEKKENLWIATKNKGLICFNLKLNKITHSYDKYKNVDRLYFDKNDNLFYLANSPDSKLIALQKINTDKVSYLELHKFSDKTATLYINYAEGNNGNIWISSGEGLLKINSNLKISAIRQKNNIQSDLLTHDIHYHFIDNMENLWLSSERKGLLMIDLNQKQFKQYKNFHSTNKVLSGENISMIYEDSKGLIWAGCFAQGITCFNPKDNTFKIIPYNSNDYTKIVFRAPAGISEDDKGNIWIGFYDGRLLCLNPVSMQIEYYDDSEENHKNYFKGSSIRSIILDHDKNLWFATNTSGLVERDANTGEFIYHSENYETDFTSNSHYRYVCQTKDGMYWTGTQNGGLGSYNKTTHEFIHYTHNASNPYSISGNTVYYIYEASDSILWVGTDKGLNKFNRNTKQFTVYQQANSEFICSIYRIFPDEENNFWLSGDCGIIKFNTKTLEYTTYSKSDGLPSSEFNTTAGYISKKGEIYLGSTLGLVSFCPKNIHKNPYPSNSKISQLKIFNKNVTPGENIKGHVVLNKEISQADSITLPYFLNDFTLEFTALHFASPLKNKYWYKLEGFNSNWIETDATRRWANYTGLKPGTYTFYLKTSNNDGLVGAENKHSKLTIEILPPFSETWWFRTLLVALILILGYSIHKIRVSSINKQRILLEKKVIKRTSELQNKNSILEERQEEISLQNEELERHRNHLEEIVEERTDIMKKALLKAEESDRLKSAFLSNMSHEIRTPMNAILGFSSLLFESTISNEEKEHFVEIIHSNGETLLNLLNDIIDISIIESGQLTINKKEFELNKQVHEVYTHFANSKDLEPKPELKIELTPPDSKIKLTTDAVRLKQILNNLIGNAMKYTQKGTISIKYYLENSKVKFSVSDTGIGIANEKIDNIFNRFNKIETHQAELYRGGGLGLAICKNLVEAMDGEIWAASEPGVGSTFYFTLPL